MLRHSKLIVGILICFSGCYQISRDSTARPSTQPTSQPSAPVLLVTEHPATKAVVDVAQTAGAVATTVQAVTPPGSPVHDWAVIVAAVSGAVIAGNEMLKRIGGNKVANQPPPEQK